MKIPKEEFEKKYNSMTVKDFAIELGVCTDTIHRIRRRLGISCKGKGSHRKVEVV